MNNSWKRYFHADSDASKNQLFMLLDSMQSDNKDEIEELMNDFDREFIAPEDIELTDNPGKMGALTLEANVPLVDWWTTH